MAGRGSGREGQKMAQILDWSRGRDPNPAVQRYKFALTLVNKFPRKKGNSQHDGIDIYEQQLLVGRKELCCAIVSTNKLSARV